METNYPNPLKDGLGFRGLFPQCSNGFMLGGLPFL